MVDVAQIADRVDRAITATIPISANLHGINPENYLQVMELAKTMATCRAGIPAWLRGSIGDCLMICSRAIRWGLDPFFVAEQSFMMEGKGGEVKVGYQSQLIHALIEAMAPLKGRLRHRFEGEGDDTICVVWGTFKGEDTPHEHRSESIANRVKAIGRSQQGNFKGSPLWLTKPRVQLFYDASRDWARINCPDVLAGVYAREELDDMKDVTPETLSKADAFAQRLKDQRLKDVEKKGFDAERIARDVALSSIVEGEAIVGEAQQEVTNDGGSRSPDDAVDSSGRDSVAGDRVGNANDAGAGGSVGEAGAVDGGVADKEGAGQVFPPDRITSGPAQGKGKDKQR